MKTRNAIFGALAAATGAVFCASAGEDLVTSAAYGSFHMDTSGKPIVVPSQAAIGELPRVTYRAGETVAATAPDGGSVPLVASAAPSAGTVAFAPTTGGLWRLVNSNGETALVGVAWSVFNDGWSLDLGSLSPFVMHTKGDGPDRRGVDYQFPPIAYSGDGWIGDSAATSTLTFIPETGESSSLDDLTGTGTTGISEAGRSFNEAELWTLRLAMSNGTTLEATIRIGIGMLLFFK